MSLIGGSGNEDAPIPIPSGDESENDMVPQKHQQKFVFDDNDYQNELDDEIKEDSNIGSNDKPQQPNSGDNSYDFFCEKRQR